MFAEYFRSIEDVWIIWIVSVSIQSAMIYYALRSGNWNSIWQFAKDERGASYALPYLMAFPFYLMLVCCVIQATMIIHVKMGVMHSSHAAARAAVVWRSSHPTDQKKSLDRAKKKAQQAAVNAIAPYASGYSGHQQLWKWGLPAGSFGEDPRVKGFAAYYPAILYSRLYKRMAQHSEAKDAPADLTYVRNKFTLAAAMTTVKLEKQHQNKFNSKLSVDVKYTMPIHIPGAGQIMGKIHWTGKGYYRDIRARATLPLETPESANRLLGIKYDPERL